jgi:23S rRNA pseudoU1915 N3-methylase RlmH
MNNNLVKVAENTYQVVESPSQNYMTSFTKWHSTTRGIAFNIPTHNEGGALNLSTIRNAENKEIILKDIQTFIENEVTALDLSDKTWTTRYCRN